MSDPAYRELEEIYADLRRELESLRPVCALSGRCCRFKEFGHKLFTTGLELDYLMERQGPPDAPVADLCPYLKGGLCEARDHRMLGCRIFFCDSNYEPQMGPLYEKYHGRIKELHRKHALPYRYGEVCEEIRRRLEEAS